ncbi:MAG: prepilin-type N-terminal cleavage/methylation domain-containing protein [Gammaproteobacteria bacterium]|nr:prepilin-type N-terminal cleavage/methylation domain-containing protein [Gammaproteobacteria bacterium]MCY4295813.1 prepilin-type N-terminal cleavage/methylation domain-containing protein [Gammaproteobacteria bacterium]
MYNEAFSARAASGGATLIEVLVALAVLSVGLAGLSATQLRTLAHLRVVVQESRAALFAADMAEQLEGAGAPGQAALERWRGEIAASLPQGSGVVCGDSTPFDGSAQAPACDGGGGFMAIKLWWDEDNDGNAERARITVLRP